MKSFNYFYFKKEKKLLKKIAIMQKYIYIQKYRISIAEVLLTQKQISLSESCITPNFKKQTPMILQ